MESEKPTRDAVLECLDGLISQLWSYQIAESRVSQLVQELTWLKADLESGALPLQESWRLNLLCAQYEKAQKTAEDAITLATELPKLLGAKPRRQTTDAYHLRLFVEGSKPTSVRALENLRRLCEMLGKSCKCDIIDITQNPALASDEKIIVTPTLVRMNPLPKRRIIGDLSDLQTALIVIGTAMPSESHITYPGHDKADSSPGIR